MPDATRPGEHQSTETQLDGASTDAGRDPRIPGLSVLYHPDLRRVGERAVLLDLVGSGEAWLSRLEQGFSAPGGASPEGDAVERRALDHPSLSRQPIRLSWEPTGATLRLDATRSPTRVVADGEELSAARTFSTAELERGVVLLLGRHITLLLHLLDPLRIPNLPRFGLVGENPGMVRLRLQIRKVANLDVPVLLRGETGSGKELAARAIHQASRRREGPFVAVNMATLPATLAAAELFGAVRGAYTGADRRRQGLFAQAHGGTLFLDEVGETPPEVQALLRRAVETDEIRPVGSEAVQKVDVRLISATDADLEAGIAAERFRAPLFYRLSGFELHLPPLRARRDDIGRLLRHFLSRELAAVGEHRRRETASGEAPWLSGELVARLVAYDWPGNVRQLLNVTRQLVINSRGEERARLPETVEMLLAAAPRPAPSGGDVPPRSPGEDAAHQPPPVRSKPSQLTDADLVAVLRAHRFNLRATAAALQISRTSLYARIEKCPRLRKPAELDRGEIEASLERAAGDVDAAAIGLEVSSLGLKRRLRELGLS